MIKGKRMLLFPRFEFVDGICQAIKVTPDSIIIEEMDWCMGEKQLFEVNALCPFFDMNKSLSFAQDVEEQEMNRFARSRLALQSKGHKLIDFILS
jgi:hypothetical protein